MSETNKTDAAETNSDSGAEEVETAPSEGGEELNVEELAEVAGGQAHHHHHPHHGKHHPHHVTAHHAKAEPHRHHSAPHHVAAHHTPAHRTVRHVVPIIPGIKK